MYVHAEENISLINVVNIMYTRTIFSNFSFQSVTVIPMTLLLFPQLFKALKSDLLSCSTNKLLQHTLESSFCGQIYTIVFSVVTFGPLCVFLKGIYKLSFPFYNLPSLHFSDLKKLSRFSMTLIADQIYFLFQC